MILVFKPPSDLQMKTAEKLGISPEVISTSSHGEIGRIIESYRKELRGFSRMRRKLFEYLQEKNIGVGDRVFYSASGSMRGRTGRVKAINNDGRVKVDWEIAKDGSPRPKSLFISPFFLEPLER